MYVSALSSSYRGSSLGVAMGPFLLKFDQQVAKRPRRLRTSHFVTLLVVGVVIADNGALGKRQRLVRQKTPK